MPLFYFFYLKFKTPAAAEFRAPQSGARRQNIRRKLFQFGSFLLSPYYTYNTHNNCQQTNQLPAGAIIKLTIYEHKHPEHY
jgi:hypothetical protein